MCGNHSGEPRKLDSGRPSAVSATLTMPMRCENSLKMMPTITTVEMKWGA